jgi:hypothetical protein
MRPATYYRGEPEALATDDDLLLIHVLVQPEGEFHCWLDLATTIFSSSTTSSSSR